MHGNIYVYIKRLCSWLSHTCHTYAYTCRIHLRIIPYDYTNTHSHWHIHTHTAEYTYIHWNTYVAYMYSNSYKFLNKYYYYNSHVSPSLTHIQTNAYTCMPTHRNSTCTHTNTLIHTHLHIYMHIYYYYSGKKKISTQKKTFWEDNKFTAKICLYIDVEDRCFSKRFQELFTTLRQRLYKGNL